jgi:hypothetical protein
MFPGWVRLHTFPMTRHPECVAIHESTAKAPDLRFGELSLGSTTYFGSCKRVEVDGMPELRFPELRQRSARRRRRAMAIS